MNFIKETRIAASPEAVFRFHEAPGALKRLIPPWDKTEILQASASIQPGTQVVLRVRIGPFPVRLVAEHVEYDPPHLFADRQASGPFAKWYHRHRFLDDGAGGTILRDEIDFEPPLGILGRWLGGWFVRRMLERTFAWRHETTRRLIETAETKNEAAGK